MAQVLFFNPESEPIANVAVSYRRSFDESQVKGRADVVVFDTAGDPEAIKDLVAEGVPMGQWVVENGTVRAMTAAEKTTVRLAEEKAGRQAARVGWLSGLTPREKLLAKQLTAKI